MSVTQRTKSVTGLFLVLALLIVGIAISGFTTNFSTAGKNSYPIVIADNSELTDESSAVVINVRTALDTARGTTYTDAQWNNETYDLTVEFQDYTTTGSLYVRLLNKDTTPVAGDIDGSTAAKSGFLVYSGSRVTFSNLKTKYAILRVNHGDGIVQVVATAK